MNSKAHAELECVRLHDTEADLGSDFSFTEA